MFTIRKKFKVEYAHQLCKAYSKCCSDQIHGHSGIIELFFKSSALDSTGMVIDFGELRKELKPYIDSWDHSLIMSDQMNKNYLKCLKKFNKNLKIVPYNPTCENMTKDIFYHIKNMGYKDLYKVRMHETDTGYGEYFE